MKLLYMAITGLVLEDGKRSHINPTFDGRERVIKEWIEFLTQSPEVELRLINDVSGMGLAIKHDVYAWT